MRLTIAIPTYERTHKCIRLVESLIPQVRDRDDVEILVIDNCSSIPYEFDQQRCECASLRVLRNPTNIGMSGNIMRCFESARGEFMWLLGDDDLAKPDAVQTVLQEIDRHGATYANFAAPLPHAVELSVSGKALLFQDVPLGNLIFISACVFRRADYLPAMAIAYRFANTLAPHFAMTVWLMQNQEQATARICTVSPVTWAAGADTWNMYYYLRNLPQLVDLCDQPSTRAALGKKIAALFHPRGAAAGVLSEFKSRHYTLGERIAVIRTIRLGAFQYASVKHRLMWLALTPCMAFPRFGEWLLGVLCRWRRAPWKIVDLTNAYDRV